MKRISGWLVIFGVVGTIVLATQAPSWGHHEVDTVAHDQVAADAVMTVRMQTDIGPAMTSEMSTYGMLDRTSNPAYTQALETHTREYEQVTGLSP